MFELSFKTDSTIFSQHHQTPLLYTTAIEILQLLYTVVHNECLPDDLYSSWRCYWGQQPIAIIRHSSSNVNHRPLWPIIQNPQPHNTTQIRMAISHQTHPHIKKPLHTTIHQPTLLRLIIHQRWQLPIHLSHAIHQRVVCIYSTVGIVFYIVYYDWGLLVDEISIVKGE